MTSDSSEGSPGRAVALGPGLGVCRSVVTSGTGSTTRDGGRDGRLRDVLAGPPSPSGVTLEDAASPSSPTCTSITTTVMLSAPPCRLAASTSRSAASPGSSTSPRMAAISSPPTSLVRPSEQRSSRSPVRNASSHMSVSTWSETPRARVRMCRWGWTAASSSVISPWRIRSSARLWSSVTWTISPSEKT